MLALGNRCLEVFPSEVLFWLLTDAEKAMNNYSFVGDFIENPVFSNEKLAVVRPNVACVLTNMRMLHDIAQSHIEIMLVLFDLGFTPISQCPTRYFFEMLFCGFSYYQAKHFLRASRPLQ